MVRNHARNLYRGRRRDSPPAPKSCCSSPTGPPQSQIQNSPRRQERGREARGGREREAQSTKEREKESGVRLLGCGGQVSGGVWSCRSQVNPREATATGGKGALPTAEETPMRGWGWSADAIGTGCRGAGALARSSLLLSVRPSLPLAEGVKDDRPRQSVPTGNATVPRKRSEGRAFALVPRKRDEGRELACAAA